VQYRTKPQYIMQGRKQKCHTELPKIQRLVDGMLLISLVITVVVLLLTW
jgi:hypothetical protein